MPLAESLRFRLGASVSFLSSASPTISAYVKYHHHSILPTRFCESHSTFHAQQFSDRSLPEWQLQTCGVELTLSVSHTIFFPTLVLCFYELSRIAHQSSHHSIVHPTSPCRFLSYPSNDNPVKRILW